MPNSVSINFGEVIINIAQRLLQISTGDKTNVFPRSKHPMNYVAEIHSMLHYIHKYPPLTRLQKEKQRLEQLIKYITSKDSE